MPRRNYRDPTGKIERNDIKECRKCKTFFEAPIKELFPTCPSCGFKPRVEVLKPTNQQERRKLWTRKLIKTYHKKSKKPS